MAEVNTMKLATVGDEALPADRVVDVGLLVLSANLDRVCRNMSPEIPVHEAARKLGHNIFEHWDHPTVVKIYSRDVTMAIECLDDTPLFDDSGTMWRHAVQYDRLPQFAAFFGDGPKTNTTDTYSAIDLMRWVFPATLYVMDSVWTAALAEVPEGARALTIPDLLRSLGDSETPVHAMLEAFVSLGAAITALYIEGRRYQPFEVWRLALRSCPHRPPPPLQN